MQARLDEQEMRLAEQQRRHKESMLQLAAVQAHLASIGVLMPGASTRASAIKTAKP